MPLHPKAKEFAKSGLFAGVKSFEELEKRISESPDDKRGAAFEVFAEAYLATQRRDFAKIWPQSTAPSTVLKRLNLPFKDMGADGVVDGVLGHCSAYQAKFRTGRTKLSWDDLSTFFGVSDSEHICSRIVITNCDDMAEVAKNRRGFISIRGSDLDRLNAEDFKVIEAWVSEAKITIKKSTPFPHQQEALDAILPALRKEDRVSAIMACGTGKTLTALWTTEQLGASKVLVLLPSLALLRQTLHEWLKETSLDLAYLCVCSDPTVKGDADEISTAQSDLDFEVSTDVATVRRFLDAPFKGTKVIFSTYQSASVVGEAMKKGETFDLGIFDEAHKTAGREGRNYGYALEDRNIPISKRLFVTATPRHYNPSKRDKEGEATIAFSMDEPKVYGPQSYVLSFGEAARRKIICGYKVIISVITSDQIEDVNDEVLSKGTVSVKGDEVRARQVANQIALRDAVAQYGVRKIFTFHSTVKSAASFVADGNEGVRTHLPDFSALHVSGAMPTARRELVMKEFRSAPRAVMSNARCLTEGVDVPAVDMVAFLSPKKSKVDIVQAIGRGIRKSGSKEVGYVLIPLYLEQKAGESLEEAVARANFEEVWDILQSLQEQDEVLAELIRDMAVAKGRGKGFDDSRFSDRISFTGPVLALESIRQAVTTRVLERLESSWDVNFGKLVKFKEEHDHCRVPERSTTHKRLGIWVTEQRKAFKKNKLSTNQIKSLDDIGFEWDPYSVDWYNWLESLHSYKKEHGDCRVPLRYKQCSGLGAWVVAQRIYYSKNKLLNERIAKLEALGFEWDIFSADWERKFQELIAYKNKNNNLRVSRSANHKELASWVSNQRSLYLKNKISRERIKKLEDIGFEWDFLKSEWNRLFEELRLYKIQHGDCRVPKRSSEYKELSPWVATQRTQYKKGKLSKDRVLKLNMLGFDWDPFASQWERNYEDLVIFKKEHGHCNVSKKYKKLRSWVSGQRVKYKKGILSSEQVSRLNEIGLVLISNQDPNNDDWRHGFEALMAYKSEFGNFRIPSSSEIYKKLRDWVSSKRRQYSRGKLSPECIALLESIEFELDPLTSDWERGLASLTIYRKEHGDCRVPVNSIKYKELGSWVSVKRRQYLKGTLSQERIALLESIGFEWDILSSIWEHNFNELSAYKALNGDCRVPTKSEIYKNLGTWVAEQRKRHKKGLLSAERASRLEKLGFEWRVPTRRS